MNSTTLSQLKIPEFKNIKCQKQHFLDKIFSNKEGLTPSSLNLIYGGAGAGKSTITCEYVSQLHIDNPDKKICFISAEMNQILLKNLSVVVPDVNKLPTFFFDQYRDVRLNPKNLTPEKIYTNILEEGYDIILIDSWEKIKGIIKTTSPNYKTAKAANDFMFTEMKKASMGGKGNNKPYTCFLVIQHVTKAGNFRGDNTLVHEFDSSLEIKKINNSDRFLKFHKNRFSEVSTKIFFEINKDGVKYNTEKFNEEKIIEKQMNSFKKSEVSEEDISFINNLMESSLKNDVSNGELVKDE